MQKLANRHSLSCLSHQRRCSVSPDLNFIVSAIMSLWPESLFLPLALPHTRAIWSSPPLHPPAHHTGFEAIEASIQSHLCHLLWLTLTYSSSSGTSNSKSQNGSINGHPPHKKNRDGWVIKNAQGCQRPGDEAYLPFSSPFLYVLLSDECLVSFKPWGTATSSWAPPWKNQLISLHLSCVGPASQGVSLYMV